jgi:DNA gyrase subunit A
VALVDGQPRTLGLKQMLEVYLEHRLDVVRRRSSFRRTKAQERLHLVEGLLIAILDIDEVIQLIRSSDDVAQAKSRLMDVFELSDIQATYILDMPLRRLTKYSTIELESEKSELERTIEELTAVLDDDALLRKVVGDELSEVAKTYGTPRRTVLLESAGAPVTSAVPLEVADDPCFVLMSSSGLLARSSNDEPLGAAGARAKHDVVTAVAAATARGTIGVVTSRGRLIKLGVLDLPALPPTANAPHLQGGAPITEFLALEPGERAVTLTSLAEDSLGLALGTSSGVVKRVQPEVLSNRDSWDVIRLDDGDQVVGGLELRSDDDELVFVTSDAQLLHFPASGVRPQGRSGGGIAGVRVAAGHRAVWFGALDVNADNLVVTVAGSSDALPGTEAGTVKVTSFAEYPGKGRGTGGVRCHRFLKGEDVLLVAYAGPAPVKAAASSGAPVDLPEEHGRRDGSGTPAAQPILAISGAPR